MKTQWTLLIAAIVVSTCTGCSHEYDLQPPDEQAINAEVKTEFFHVHPSGSTVTAFDGNVLIDFPSGTIPTITQFAIVSFPLGHLDLHGKNLMERGFTIKNITNDSKFAYPVKIIVRYDQADFKECQPNDESDLSIYRFYGDRYAYHKIEYIGECCVNCSCKTVNVCIYECGTYVVVEN